MAKPEEKTPEELIAELERQEKTLASEQVKIDAKKKKLADDVKAAKQKSIAEAIAHITKSEPDDKKGQFEELYEKFIAHRNSATGKQAQVARLQTEILSDLDYVKTQHPIIRTTLVGTGKVKESYLNEFLGEPPTVKTARPAGEGGGKGKRTKAKLPDGTTLSWTDLLEKYSVPHKEGDSAHREWDSAAKDRTDLPKVEVVE